LKTATQIPTQICHGLSRFVSDSVGHKRVDFIDFSVNFGLYRTEWEGNMVPEAGFEKAD
jgi:hypothetical protein